MRTLVPNLTAGWFRQQTLHYLSAFNSNKPFTIICAVLYVTTLPANAQNSEVAKARKLLNLFLTTGQRQNYVAEQTTRLTNSSMQESKLIVKKGGLGKERLEFVAPSKNTGEVILTSGFRMWNYKPRQNRIFEGFVALDGFQLRAKQIRDDITSGKLKMRIVGNEIIAGRSATILEFAGESGLEKLWIDDVTGVRLKHEEVNSEGSVVQSSYFTRIDYDAIINTNDFRPDMLPKVPHQPVFPLGTPIESVAAAQSKVSYTILEPAIPSGYKLTGVWLVDAAKGVPITVLRYSDGPRNIALFEQPVGPNVVATGGVVKPRNGVAHWVSESHIFTLLGNMSPNTMRDIIRSLRKPDQPIPK